MTTTMTAAAVKARVRAHLAYWIPALGLEWNDFAIRWHRPPDMKPKTFATYAALIDRAHLDTRSRTQDVAISFNISGIARTIRTGRGDERWIEVTVVHELLHAVVGSRESVIDFLANALVAVRRGERRPILREVA